VGAVRRPPTRSCVACRTARQKRELLRIVRTPSGTIAADQSGRLAGRGAYVCRQESCITIAIQRGALTRALEIPVPAALLETLAVTLTESNIQEEARGQE
jgi:hypothetical protein